MHRAASPVAKRTRGVLFFLTLYGGSLARLKKNKRKEKRKRSCALIKRKFFEKKKGPQAVFFFAWITTFARSHFFFEILNIPYIFRCEQISRLLHPASARAVPHLFRHSIVYRLYYYSLKFTCYIKFFFSPSLFFSSALFTTARQLQDATSAVVIASSPVVYCCNVVSAYFLKFVAVQRRLQEDTVVFTRFFFLARADSSKFLIGHRFSCASTGLFNCLCLFLLNSTFTKLKWGSTQCEREQSELFKLYRVSAA